MKDELAILRMAIEQRLPLTAVIAANGPTIDTVLARLEVQAVEFESLRRLKKHLEEQVDTVDDDEGQPKGNEASNLLVQWTYNEWAHYGRYV